MQSVTVLTKVIEEVDAGRSAALCIVLAARGSTPQGPGAMLCVDPAAHITGTIGGGCVEAEVRRRAYEMLGSGVVHTANPTGRREPHDHAFGEGMAPAPGKTPQSSTAPGVLGTFDLDHDFGHDDGVICGGQLDVAICVYAEPNQTEPLRQALGQLRTGEAVTIPITVTRADGPVAYCLHVEPSPKLVIAGGGHVGRHVAEFMVRLGFQVSVVDDRTEFANAERFPPPIQPVVGDIAETLSKWPIDANTYVVIVTRGHKHDETALRAVIHTPAKYVGMIGSRRKITVIFDDLMHEGVAKEQLDRVHAPIGIAIRGVTPEEIALSIAAELVSVRRERYRKAVEGPMPLADGART